MLPYSHGGRPAKAPKGGLATRVLCVLLLFLSTYLYVQLSSISRENRSFAAQLDTLRGELGSARVAGDAAQKSASALGAKREELKALVEELKAKLAASNEKADAAEAKVAQAEKSVSAALSAAIGAAKGSGAEKTEKSDAPVAAKGGEKGADATPPPPAFPPPPVQPAAGGGEKGAADAAGAVDLSADKVKEGDKKEGDKKEGDKPAAEEGDANAGRQGEHLLRRRSE